MGIRSLISCMTRNVPYRIALFTWNVIGRFHGCHCMCILGGEVALVGEFFYWALLIQSWDPLSVTGGVQGDDVPMRP